MPYQPPWTDIGRIQQDVDQIKSELHRKADSHEIYQIKSTLDRLEHSIGEVSALSSGLSSAVETLQNKIEVLWDHYEAELLKGVKP
jgi:hypothetical protein